MEPEPTPAPVAHKAITALTLIITILATALVAGGGVYFYEKSQQETATQDLQSQVDLLKAQVDAQATAIPTPSATASPSANPIAACSSSNLKLSLVDNGGGTAGTTYRNIVLTNSGSESCTLSGFPKVSLLSGTDKVLGTATNSSTVTSTDLTITAGSAVYAAVGFPDSGNFSAGTCSAAAAKLSVTPPGSSAALTIASTEPYCPGFSVTALSATKL